MSDNREELTQNDFLFAYEKSEAKIKIRISNNSIKVDNCSAILVAHDEQGKLTTIDKNLNKKEGGKDFKKAHYPLFCLIYNRTPDSNTASNFDILVDNLKQIINASGVNLCNLLPENPKSVSLSIEDYYRNKESHYSTTFDNIIRCFSEEKNRGSAICLLRFNYSERPVRITEVYDFEAETIKRKHLFDTLSNRISELESFEKRDDIKSLIAYYRPDTSDGKNLFNEGIERNKDILSNRQRNPEFSNIEDLELLKNNVTKFIKKLNDLCIEYEQAMQNLMRNMDKFKNVCQFKENLSAEAREKLEKHEVYSQYNALLSQFEEQEKNPSWNKKEVTDIQEEITVISSQLQALKIKYETEDSKKHHIQKTIQAIDALEEKIKSDSNNLYGSALTSFHAENFIEAINEVKANLNALLNNEKQLSACTFDAISEPFKTLQSSYEEKIKEIKNEHNKFEKEIEGKFSSITQKFNEHIRRLKGEKPIGLRDKLINFIFKPATNKKIMLETLAVSTLGKIKSCIDNLSNNENKNTVELKEHFDNLDRIFQNKSFSQHRGCCLFFGLKPVTSKGIADETTTLVNKLKSEFINA